MIRACKKLVTDIGRKADLEIKIPEYADTLGKQYNFYSMVKMCMNYYTMKSMVEEGIDENNSDVKKHYDAVSELITRYVIGNGEIDANVIGKIDEIRNSIENKMKVLTAYTDGLQIYEYILNRVEARVKGNVMTVDTDVLSERMFAYVFQENDTVVINSKIKLLMEQLPVRMTKNKFFDVVANTLTIYKGGDKNSVDEFVDMLRTAVLIKKPNHFETEYPFLFSAYENLKIADYANLDEECYDRLLENLNFAADMINSEASLYMLLQEIVNDTYTILLTHTVARSMNEGTTGYDAAMSVLEESVRDITVDELTDNLMSKFVLLEGVQEDCYESVMILETVLDDVKKSDKELLESLALCDRIVDLNKASKLLSTSLFIPLDKDFDEISEEVADNDYIMELRDSLIEEFKVLFADNTRLVNRSMMCKILASMPIFLNNKQDLKDYFDYVLTNCNDDSELSACSNLINEIIEE